MKPYSIKTEHADYEPAPWGADDKPPIRPLGDQVLVLGDKAVRQKGSITVMTDVEGDRLDRAAITGSIIAAGPDAWSFNASSTRPFAGEKPKAGMRVTFTRYAGQATHLDGRTYFLMSDTAIGGELLSEAIKRG